MIPRKAVVKSPTVPFRHQTSGDDMVALNLRTKPLIAVPTGVARPEDSLDSMVIPGIVRKDGVIVDENKREYVKVAKVLQTQNSEIHLVQIIDRVQSQVFVGKQVPHPPAALAVPRGLGAKRSLRPKNIVPPGPFNNPDLENEVRTTLSDMSLDGDRAHPSPFATHAVVVTDDFSLVLLPVGHADGFNVFRNIYDTKKKAQESGDPEAIARLRQLTINIALQMGHQVWRELAGYHGKDLAHRDLKLENIFVTEHGVASIGDQGLTAPADCFDNKLGTHQAPEGHLGHFVDPKKLDVWALSVAFMQLLSDQVLFSLTTQALYNPRTVEGRATLRADMETYTNVWMRFGGQLTDDEVVAIKQLHREPQGVKKPEGTKSQHRSTASRSSTMRPTHKRRGSSRSIASRGSTSSLSSLALTRVRSAPLEEPEDDWADDSAFTPELVREKFEEMQRNDPALGEYVALLLRTDLDPEIVADYRAAVVESLQSMQSEDPTLFPVLFRMAQIVPENEARLLTPANMARSLSHTLETDYDLSVLWRQMAHALSFSETCLSAKFEALREATPEPLFKLILKGLHPLPGARPSAQEMADAFAQPLFQLDEEATKDVRAKLAEVKGDAWQKFEAFRDAYQVPARPTLHQRMGRTDKRPRRHSVASPTADQPRPYLGSPLIKRENSDPTSQS